MTNDTELYNETLRLYWEQGLKFTMDDLSDYKRQARRSPAMLQVIMSNLSNLLVTEGDRRRVQIELSRPGEVTAAQDKTIKMDEWRRKLS